MHASNMAVDAGTRSGVSQFALYAQTIEARVLQFTRGCRASAAHAGFGSSLIIREDGFTRIIPRAQCNREGIDLRALFLITSTKHVACNYNTPRMSFIVFVLLAYCCLSYSISKQREVISSYLFYHFIIFILYPTSMKAVKNSIKTDKNSQ